VLAPSQPSNSKCSPSRTAAAAVRSGAIHSEFGLVHSGICDTFTTLALGRLPRLFQKQVARRLRRFIFEVSGKPLWLQSHSG